MNLLKPQYKIVFSIILLFSAKPLFAQPTITGPNCVGTGIEYQYTISGNWNSSTNMQWCVIGGYLSGTTNTCITGTPVVYIRVIWNNVGSGSVQLNSSIGNASVNVTIQPPLQPGTLTSNVTQSVAYYAIPAQIGASAATGGGCTPNYAYQWQSSKDMLSWTDMAGKTGQNLVFTAPQQETFYYRRKVTETSSSTTLYSTIAPVNVVNTPSSATCSGILGPANVAVNFGTGANPGPALPAGVTTYTYNAGAVSSGQYSIRNSTTNYRSQWYSIPTDHTPNDVNGYMMIIDGDEKAAEFYRTPATGLTSNFRYEFSAWVGNLDNAAGFQNPDITFDLYSTPDGALLGTSGSIKVPYTAAFKWKRISFMFDIPLNVNTVDIVITNNNRLTGGNDLVIDDIGFAPCYPAVLASFASGSIVDKKWTCNSGPATLYASWSTAIPFSNPSYQWQRSVGNNGNSWANIGAATTTISYNQTENTAGIYQYRVIAQESADHSKFVISNPITYYVQNLLVNPTTFPVLACNTAPYQLNPTYLLQYADPAGPPLTYTFLWSPSTYLSSSTVANPTISLPALPPNPDPSLPEPAPVTYNYTLSMKNNQFGCTGVAGMVVSHQNPRKVWVPSAFTPDGDGVNDVFRPLGLEDYAGGIFRVYNRWGQMIYEESVPTVSPNRMHGWDGTFNSYPQDAGTYTWTVYMPACTTNISPPEGNGTVVLIR